MKKIETWTAAGLAVATFLVVSTALAAVIPAAEVEAHLVSTLD